MVVHLLCAFTAFCAGGACEDYTPLEMSLRFQPGRDIAEVWTTPEFASTPWPAVTVAGGPFDGRRHFFLSGQISGTYLISLAQDHGSATLTTHLPRPAIASDSGATSSQGPCRAVEDRT